MNSAAFHSMRFDEPYHAYHVLGDKCVIKKLAESDGQGLLLVLYEDGSEGMCHFSLLSLSSG